MADAVISIVVERVAAIIEDQIRYQVNLVRGVEKKVLELSDKLVTIKNVLDDAEKRGVNDKSVKNWLRKLEDVAYEMDDILDEWNYTLLKLNQSSAHPSRKVCCSSVPSPSSSSCLCFNKVVGRLETAKKIEYVKDRLDQIMKEKDEFNFVMSLPSTDPVPSSWRVQSTSLVEFDKVCGRGRDRDDIVSKLMMNGNGDCQIVSIVGMGGLGKTTLAQLVYNDPRVKGCFELRIWICVSDPFDVAGIARGIVASVGRETATPPNADQLDSTLQILSSCISGKRFLLVLDDVWTEDYDKWEPLKITLGDGGGGSKILVTTRKERVAMMMGTSEEDVYRPQQLSDEECWTVLRRKSFPGRRVEECGGFEGVGKKIASKCKGLPLAANVLGSILQFKNSLEEWTNVLESEIWELEEAEVNLFPHLVLSYNELSPALRRCFSYCAVYPKDSQIYAKRLVEEWMALGYLGSVTGDCGVELKGLDYFNNLVMRSLFQEFKRDDTGEIEWCKMHDVVHDFALFLRKNNVRAEAAETAKRSCQVSDTHLVSQAKEYRSLLWGRESPTDLCDRLTSLRVLNFQGKLSGTPKGMEKLIHLRKLALSFTILSEKDLEIICRLYFLQTLLLNSCLIEEIPREIGNLVHLRHLDLSENDEIKELPVSMCSLVELRILSIDHCSDLHRLPEGIDRLQNLQHLHIAGTPMGHCLPRVIGQLHGLRALRMDSEYNRSELVVGSQFNRLELLKNLNSLTGSLRLEIHIDTVSNMVEDAREAELRKKMHIRILELAFEKNEDESSSISPWVDVIEALEPHHNLKYLCISGYGGSRLPCWISSPFYLIKMIVLSDFSEMSSLLPMGKLPYLEVLNIQDLRELKVVGREFLGTQSPASTNGVVAFPKLEKLTFADCNKWEEWEDLTAEEDDEEDYVVMPSLTKLKILRCSGLKKLPHNILRKASSSLRILKIKSSPELQNTYGDENGSPWRSLSRNNPQLQLHQ